MPKEELAKEEAVLQRGRQYVAEQVTEIWDNLGKNNLWKRILKNVIATTLLGRFPFQTAVMLCSSSFLQLAYL
jgi:hypothetical protein